MATANNSIKVLCLHEEGSNAIHLKDSLRRLGDQLWTSHGIDLIYVNAPLLSESTTTVKTGASWKEHGSRVWWESHQELSESSKSAIPVSSKESEGNSWFNSDDDEDDESLWQNLHGQQEMDKEDGDKEEEGSHLGLDASLLLLQQVWRSSFVVGLLGVGSGASVGGLLTLLLQQLQQNPANDESNHVILPPQFAVWINARSSLLPDVNEPLYLNDNQRNPHFLHVYSTDDSSNNRNFREEALLHFQQFGGEWHETSTTYSLGNESSDASSARNEASSTAPVSSSLWNPSLDDMNRIGRFLVSQKKRLSTLYEPQGHLANDQPQHRINESAALVAMQQTLKDTEQYASNLIAQKIAKNPPKALMAVIRPSEVSGREGDKQDRPPAGGAPCPSEFLLHRAKRNETTRGGPSRVHPNDASAKENQETL